MNSVTLDNLKQFRLDNGWTQDVVSQLSGVSSRTLQRIESGGSTSIETAKSLASVFELDSYKSLSSNNPFTEPSTNHPALSEHNMEQNSKHEDVVESTVVNHEGSWWERHIDYSPVGILTTAILALVLMSVRYLLPTSLTQEEIVLCMHFSKLFTLAMILVIMRKLMQGVGIWGEVCNMFRRHPEPVELSETASGLSLFVLGLLLSLYGYVLWFNVIIPFT